MAKTKAAEKAKTAPKRPAKAKPAATRAPAVSARQSSLGGDVIAQLVAACVAARENNHTTELMDAANRHWFVGVEPIGNHSHVVIRVHRGKDTRVTSLSTATFTAETAAAAVDNLDGELS